MTTLNQAMKALNIRQGVTAALSNEYTTRQRVEVLERSVTDANKRAEGVRAELRAFAGRGFRARLRWVLFGR